MTKRKKKKTDLGIKSRYYTYLRSWLREMGEDTEEGGTRERGEGNEPFFCLGGEKERESEG